MVLFDRDRSVAFFELAADFCRWCESDGPELVTDRAVAHWLTRLSAAALELSETEPATDDDVPRATPADVERVRARLARLSGRYYRYVYDPDVDSDEEPVIGALLDDLLDVYRDVKSGCMLFARGEHADALWHWRFSHHHHWGAHALAAATALHADATRTK